MIAHDEWKTRDEAGPSSQPQPWDCELEGLPPLPRSWLFLLLESSELSLSFRLL